MKNADMFGNFKRPHKHDIVKFAWHHCDLRYIETIAGCNLSGLCLVN